VPEAVPLARRAVAAVAEAAGVEGERLEDIRLAVSEAVTNAVIHAYRSGSRGRFHVTVALASGELWVLISDDGRGVHAWNDSQGLGIGLSLISGFSDDFSIVPRATGGTEVRMRFDVRTAGRGSRRIRPEDRSLQRPVRPHLASQR
jgi:anti-sigma regulatory factor (Ser/Thr protein kinase)